MSDTIIPRRSVLYMPASNQRALEKARSLEADCFIFDLEDAVAPEQKAIARQQAVQAVNDGGYGSAVVAIRINSLATPWGLEDLKAVDKSSADAIVLPKVEAEHEILEVVDQLENTGLEIWAMIETPLGVLNVEEICDATSRLNVIMMGTSDLAKELRVPHSAARLGLVYSLSKCVMAARAHHLDIIDGVYLDLGDTQGFGQSCEQGRQLGFDGKSLIHPKQLSDANRVFAPDPSEVEQAQDIIDAWNRVQRNGKGLVVVDGKLVENLHVEEARRTLKLNEKTSAMRRAPD